MKAERPIEQKLFRFVIGTFDLLMIPFMGIVAFFLFSPKPSITPHYWNVMWLAMGVAFVVFQQVGLYKPFRETRFLTHLLKITFALTMVVFVLLIVLFVSHVTEYYSRAWWVSWFLLTWAALVLTRIGVWCLLTYFRKRGWNIRRVVVIGAGEYATHVIKKINRASWIGTRIVTYISMDAEPPVRVDKVSVRKMPSDVTKFIRRANPHEVWIILPLKEEETIKSFAYALRDELVNVRYIPDVFGLSFHQHAMSEIAGLPLLDLYSSPLQGWNWFVKEVEDKSLAAIITLVISPVLLAIAVAIKFDSKGPVIFKQKRHGWNGKPFTVYKFRTMKAHKEAEGRVTQATRDDARVTRVGKFLRATSLDELPQLFNVLEGSMSLVGPRPHAIVHDEHYRNLVESYMQRHKVKPGITGWAQVNGWRGETDTLDKMEKRVEHDLYYIEHWHLFFDIRIIIMTLWRGFISRNAY